MHRGGYDDGSSRGLFPFLINTSLAVFQMAGKLSCVMQLLNMSRTCLGLSSTVFFRISFGTSSDPGAIFTFNVLVARFISVSVTRTGFSSTGQLVSSLCGCVGKRPSTMTSILPGILIPGIGAFLHSLPITIFNFLPHGSVSTTCRVFF